MKRLYRSMFKTDFMLNRAFKMCPDQRQRLQIRRFRNTRLFLSHVDRYEIRFWNTKYRMVKNNVVFLHRNKIIERPLTSSLYEYLSKELQNV